MRPKLTKLLFPGLMAIVAGVIGLWSCQSIEPYPDGGNGNTYSAFAYGDEGSTQIVLDCLTGSVAKIDCSTTWLKAAESGQSASGHPIVEIQYTNGSGGKADVTVTDGSGAKAVITVQHQQLSGGDDDGANASFMTRWWTYSEIKLEGIDAPQAAPWTEEGSAHIPEELRMSYLPEDGWEMAFSYVNDANLKGVRSFGLYNRWTGLLRVFTYIESTVGWGNEILFRTSFGCTMDTEAMYPFYHCFQYGVPTNHLQGTNLKKNAQIIDGQGQTFMTWVGPYLLEPNKSITPGWYAFDYDMSAYVPKGIDWLEKGKGARFKIEADTKETSTITLRGSLSGKIDGEFENPQEIQKGGTSGLYGFSTVLSTLAGVASGSISGCASYAKALEAQQKDNGFANKIHLSEIKYWGGFGCSVGAFMFGKLAEITDPVTYEHVPGKIDLNLDASLELGGYLTHSTANDYSPLSVSRDKIQSANGANGHMGHGLWGLAEDPVVYIDKDVILSSVRTVNLAKSKDADNLYTNPSIPGYDLRMVYIFDPTSVKINLNTEDLKGIEKVYVATSCGVYSDRVKGNTAPYRDMLYLNNPVIDISGGKNVVRLSTTSKPRLVVVKPSDVLSDNDEEEIETKSNSSLWEQPVTSEGQEPAFRFYGRKVKGVGPSLNVIVDPQVYLPYYKKCDTYYMNGPVAPDFVVSVQIVFESEGNTFTFSKTFIPRIEVVDHATARQKVQSIKAYAAKCEQGQPTTTLANDTSVPVYNSDGHILVDKLIHMHDDFIK